MVRNVKKLHIHAACTLALLAQLLVVAEIAIAGPRDQANQMFNRLNGVPPSPATLDAMAQKIASNDYMGAAMLAINDAGGMFYNLLLKDVVSRWTNVDKTPRVDLNDYTATVIGMIRDDVPFNQVLSGDIVYTGDTTKVTGLPAYSLANNDHYKFLDVNASNLKDVLIQQKQSVVAPTLPADATAGVMTTRGFANAYYNMGTNRRAVAFTLDNFLCRDLPRLADTTRSDFRVRRDVTRAPGGDTALFRNRCAGCHAGMDAFGGAFAYYDFNAQNTLVYTANQVQEKFNRNATEFKDGYVTVDDGWINNWTQGQNAVLGWHGEASGNGAKAFGEMLTATDVFSDCMAQRAVAAMCLHDPTSQAELDAMKQIADDFRKDFNMKKAFAAAAVACTMP